MATIQKRTTRDGYRFDAIIRIKGHPHRKKSFRRKTDARVWAQKTEAAIREGQLVPTSREQRRTVGELFDAYLAEVVPSYSPRAQRDRERHLGWWRRRLGQFFLRELGRAPITEGMRALRNGDTPSGKPSGPANCNRYLETLRHALSWAVREEWIEVNPATGLKLTEPRGRTRFLSDEERERLLEASKGTGRLELLVLLAISTGARRGELMGLRWDDIDWERRVAILHQTKNGDRRALPLRGRALELLTERHVEAEYRWVFGTYRTGTEAPTFPGTTWRRVRAKAGLKDLRFHDLRHTTASYLAMNGATLAEIAEVLGHKTLAMVKRYAHLTDSHTHSVVERMVERYLG